MSIEKKRGEKEGGGESVDGEIGNDADERVAGDNQSAARTGAEGVFEDGKSNDKEEEKSREEKIKDAEDNYAEAVRDYYRLPDGDDRRYDPIDRQAKYRKILQDLGGFDLEKLRRISKNAENDVNNEQT